MQVTETLNEGLKRKLSLVIPKSDLTSRLETRLSELRNQANIKGFRPGKVPAKVIEQRYGSQVRAEVLDGLLREGFDQAVRGNDLRIAGSPTIEPAEAKEGEIAYVATFEVVQTELKQTWAWTVIAPVAGP